jgi:hypothetical protein
MESNMKQLIEVVKIVAEKYMQNVDLIIADGYLTLEYLTDINDEKDIYKTIKIEEFEDKLKLTIYPEKFEKLIDVEEIEDIILILEKQSKKEEHTKEEIKYIKEKYKVGSEIELIKMYDFQAPAPGTKGIIDHIDDIGTLHVKWENGSALGLVVGTDEFKVLEENLDKGNKNAMNEEEILKHFDKLFKTDALKHIDFSNMKLLKILFNYFEEDIYRPSEKYEKLRHRLIDVEEELNDTFTENQKKLFEKYYELSNRLSVEEEQQLFLFGYIIAKELDTEAKVLDD